MLIVKKLKGFLSRVMIRIRRREKVEPLDFGTTAMVDSMVPRFLFAL